MLYQDSAISNNTSGATYNDCEAMLPSVYYSYSSVVRDRLLDSKAECLCSEGRKLINAQHHSFFPTASGGGWARSVFVCIKVIECRVEDKLFLSTDVMLHYIVVKI
jgi:hypothetical protein